jgi:hypothetical protein
MRSQGRGTQWITLVCLSLALWGASTAMGADEPPARRIVEVPLQSEPEFSYGTKGNKVRMNIDKVVVPIPAEIAAAVKAWTGDIDTLGRAKGIKVVFFHAPHNATYKAMSSGDTGSLKAKITIAGQDFVDEETHVRYREALSACDEQTFFVLGIYEFENARTNRKCSVVCQFAGKKPPADDQDPIIHPVGTATWTGPIVDYQSPLFDARKEVDAGTP